MLRNHIIFNLSILIVTLLTTNIAIANYNSPKKQDSNITHILQNAKQYLQQRINNNKPQKKLAIIFNINKQVIEHLQQKRQTHFFTPPGMFYDASTYKDTQITSILNFYKFAKKNKLTIFFIDDDNQKNRKRIVKILRSPGYEKFDLFLSESKSQSDKSFKNEINKQITKQGYDIVLNINDDDDTDDNNYYNNGFADKTIIIPKTFYSYQ